MLHFVAQKDWVFQHRDSRGNPAMRDSQWREIEAIVKHIVSRAQEDPSEVERLMPHLRRVVEQMPTRRWNWWWGSWGKKGGEKL